MCNRKFQHQTQTSIRKYQWTKGRSFKLSSQRREKNKKWRYTMGQYQTIFALYKGKTPIERNNG